LGCEGLSHLIDLRAESGQHFISYLTHFCHQSAPCIFVIVVVILLSEEGIEMKKNEEKDRERERKSLAVNIESNQSNCRLGLFSNKIIELRPCGIS